MLNLFSGIQFIFSGMREIVALILFDIKTV
jgi:hypothetical protein